MRRFGETLGEFEKLGLGSRPDELSNHRAGGDREDGWHRANPKTRGERRVLHRVDFHYLDTTLKLLRDLSEGRRDLPTSGSVVAPEIDQGR